MATPEEKAALEWLDRTGPCASWQPFTQDSVQHRATLKAMLARPVMPKPEGSNGVELVRAIKEAWRQGGVEVDGPTSVALIACQALYTSLTKPATKEVEVWRVEWAERDWKFVTDSWVAHVKQFYGEDSAHEYTRGLEERKDRETRCIRVTGPHKQLVPSP